MRPSLAFALTLAALLPAVAHGGERTAPPKPETAQTPPKGTDRKAAPGTERPPDEAAAQAPANAKPKPAAEKAEAAAKQEPPAPPAAEKPCEPVKPCAID